MSVYVGEIYGKQTATKLVMYNVIKVTNLMITLQNIDNPLSLFEITPHKLSSSGYLRISQTPFIDISRNKNKSLKKPTRCPFTLDFLESRADIERPAPIIPDMFSA